MMKNIHRQPIFHNQNKTEVARMSDFIYLNLLGY